MGFNKRVLQTNPELEIGFDKHTCKLSCHRNTLANWTGDQYTECGDPHELRLWDPASRNFY